MRVGTKSDAFDREGMKVDEADLRVIKGLMYGNERVKDTK